jgi:hypothetical protein
MACLSILDATLELFPSGVHQLHRLWIELRMVLLQPTEHPRQLSCTQIQIRLKNNRRRHVLSIFGRVTLLRQLRRQSGQGLLTN